MPFPSYSRARSFSTRRRGQVEARVIMETAVAEMKEMKEKSRDTQEGSQPGGQGGATPGPASKL